MASFAPRDDGLFDVTLDTGITVPMALSEQQLMSGGFQPAPPPQPVAMAPSPAPELYAAPPMAAPPPMTQPQGLAQAAPPNMTPAAGMSAPPQAPMSRLDAPPAAASPRALEAGVNRVFEQYGAAPVEQKRLVPATGTPGGQAPPSQGEQLDAATKMYMRGLGRGGYARTPEVPEHDELVGFSVGVGKKPDETATLHAAIEERLAEDRAREAAGVEAGRMATMGGAVARQAEEDRKRLEDEMQRRRDIDTEIDRRRQAVDARLAQAEQMSADPNKFVKDLGALGGLFAAVAAALGSYGAAKTGGPNYALEILENAKKQAYQAQLDAIQKVRGDAEGQRIALADMIRDHGDPRTAKMEFMMQMDEIFDRKLKADALKSGSEQVIADTNALLAERSAQRAQQKEMLSMQMADDVQQTWRHVPYQASRVVGGPADPLTIAKKGAQYREAMGKAMGYEPGALDPKDMRERLIPGEGYAYSSEEGKALRATKVAVKSIDQMADEALAIRAQVASGKLDPVVGKRRLESLGGQIMSTYRTSEQLGTMDKGLQDVMGDIYGRPDAFLSLDSVGANEKIRQFKKGVGDKWDNVRRSQISRDPYGQQPAMSELPSSFQGKK